MCSLCVNADRRTTHLLHAMHDIAESGSNISFGDFPLFGCPRINVSFTDSYLFRVVLGYTGLSDGTCGESSLVFKSLRPRSVHGTSLTRADGTRTGRRPDDVNTLTTTKYLIGSRYHDAPLFQRCRTWYGWLRKRRVEIMNYNSWVRDIRAVDEAKPFSTHRAHCFPELYAVIYLAKLTQSAQLKVKTDFAGRNASTGPPASSALVVRGFCG